MAPIFSPGTRAHRGRAPPPERRRQRLPCLRHQGRGHRARGRPCGCGSSGPAGSIGEVGVPLWSATTAFEPSADHVGHFQRAFQPLTPCRRRYLRAEMRFEGQARRWEGVVVPGGRSPSRLDEVLPRVGRHIGDKLVWRVMVSLPEFRAFLENMVGQRFHQGLLTSFPENSEGARVVGHNLLVVEQVLLVPDNGPCVVANLLITVRQRSGSGAGSAGSGARRNITSRGRWGAKGPHVI